jgi:hypothetical protein
MKNAVIWDVTRVALKGADVSEERIASIIAVTWFGEIFIGQKGIMDIRLKEHQRNIRLELLVKSVVTEYSIDQGHCIQFHNSFILATKTRYMDGIVM